MQYRRTFLKLSLGLVGAGWLSASSVSANAFADMHLRAGAGRSTVILNGLYPLDDFVGEHDPLSTRVVLLERDGQKQALVSVDLTSLTTDVIARLKAVLMRVAGVPPEQVVVCASHSFSTPHIFLEATPRAGGGGGGPEDTQSAMVNTNATLSAFETALGAATQKAVATLQPARLGAGSGFSRIGVNRNVATAYGWWLGADDAGFSDPAVGVVRIDGKDGKPLAILMNAAVQPAIMDASERAAGGRLVSADLAGAATHYVESHYGGDTVALYLVGAAGDQVPYLQASRHVTCTDGSATRIDMHEAGFTLLDPLGQRLGDEVIRVCDSISPFDSTTLDLKRDGVILSAQASFPGSPPKGPIRAFDYRVVGTTTMPIVLMRWGEVVMVGVQPEFSAIVGARIKAASPYAHTLILTMADGAAKYLPDATSYDRFTYEARSSPFARGSAEAAIHAVIKNLKQMKG